MKPWIKAAVASVAIGWIDTILFTTPNGEKILEFGARVVFPGFITGITPPKPVIKPSKLDGDWLNSSAYSIVEYERALDLLEGRIRICECGLLTANINGRCDHPRKGKR